MRFFVLRVSGASGGGWGGFGRRRPAPRAPARVWRGASAAVGTRLRLGVVRLGPRHLPQRRDRTGDALPQDALVVAQPPPAHVGGSCRVLDLIQTWLRIWRRLGADLASALASRLLGFAAFLSSSAFLGFVAELFLSAAFSGFFLGDFFAGLSGLVVGGLGGRSSPRPSPSRAGLPLRSWPSGLSASDLASALRPWRRSSRIPPSVRWSAAAGAAESRHRPPPGQAPSAPA